MPVYELIARAMAWQAANPHKIAAERAWLQTPDFEKIGYLYLARAFLAEMGA